MPSFSIPLSGLQADSTALNTIANNLANMNTTAYKDQTTSFSDLFYQQVGTAGSGDPLQVGTGSHVASISTNFTVGSPNSTGTASNVALQGDGFFVIQGSGGGVTDYTRDGIFGVTETGDLVTESGLGVMGYPANTSGVVQTNAALVPLNIPIGKVQQPHATSSIALTGNLQADSGQATTALTLTGNLDTTGAAPAPQTVVMIDSTGAQQTATITYTPMAAAGDYSYAIHLAGTTAASDQLGTLTYSGTNYTNSLSSASVPGLADGGSVSFAINTAGITQTSGSASAVGSATDGIAASAAEPITIYDSLGVQHVATISFLKDSSAPRTWNYNITLPPGDTTSPPANNIGKLAFDGTGALVPGTADVTGVKFSGFSDGASDLTFDWSLLGSSTISQTSAATSFSGTTQDGYQAGNYKGYSINTQGIVQAVFDNGQTTAVGQIAVAMVTNEQGLAKIGNGQYAATSASGQASIGVAGTGGRGTMEGGYLEASNVDISVEFSNLIVAQRAFQANSKTITTFDTVTEQAINMLR